MKFLSKAECEEWLSGRGIELPSHNRCIVRRNAYPSKPYQMFPLAQWMTYELSHRESVLLWITEWGMWKSSENSHLYYRLRQTYGDNRLLYEAPGHLFMGHEREDLVTFLQIAMLNGWGGYFIPVPYGMTAFFSHDEYIEFFAEEETAFIPVDEWFKVK